MDHHAKTKKTGKARIPDHLRRRALVSCDRCKKRRIRCSRSSGTDANEACQSCLEVGVNCESTLPRKTRIYGSVETLSVRYRVLDALIKGLYPQKDTNNIETLYAIAEANDITLPTFDEQTVAEEVFHQPPSKHVATSPQNSADSGGSPSTTLKEPEVVIIPDGKPEKIPEEKLVPMPHGPSHYIGPSSSFGFVLTVRNMVADLTAALRTIHPDDERAKLSSEFGGSNWSKALEPIIKDESDSSEDNIDRNLMEAPSVPGRRSRVPSLFPGSAEGNALSRMKKATVLSLLPTKDVTDTFIEAYFEHVHPNYLLFHRPTFQLRYEAMWSQPHVLMRDIEQGWMCCIFMMLVFGAQALEDRDKKQSVQIQRHYLNLVQARMHQLISATTLINVQAILLLQLYQHNCTERNSAFMLLGCASRMAMALGMHREGTSGGFDDTEKEIRKRVWWTTYMFEQTQCAILGRPCAIDDSEVNITFPDELMLDGGMSVPPGYIEYSVQLAKLLSDIRRKIYATPTNLKQQGESPKISVAVQCLLDLDSWHHSLPQSLRLECLSSLPKHRRAVLLLHIQFHHTQSLVARPFILRKVGVQLARRLGKHVRSQDLDQEELNLSDACGTYSRKAALLLHQLLASGMFDGVAWLDAFYIYQSVFIMALDFLARPWDESDSPEDLARKKAVRDVMGALQNVKLCPTYTILTQVALQLAKIVGILDARSDQLVKSEEYRRYMEQQQATFTFDYSSQNIPGGTSGNVVQNWFQKDPVDLPWELKDFFGTEGFIGGSTTSVAGQPFQGIPMSLAGSYASNIVPMIDEEALAAPVPPHNAYNPHWGAVEAPYVPHNRNGSLPRGSRLH
jgi:proline utilization trans-activator